MLSSKFIALVMPTIHSTVTAELSHGTRSMVIETSVTTNNTAATSCPASLIHGERVKRSSQKPRNDTIVAPTRILTSWVIL